MRRSLYDVLGVPSTANAAEIRAAHRRLLKELHPDKHPPAQRGETARAAAEANPARDVLLDPESRAAHDRELRGPVATILMSADLWSPPTSNVPPPDDPLDRFLAALDRKDAAGTLFSGISTVLKFRRDLRAWDKLGRENQSRLQRRRHRGRMHPDAHEGGSRAGTADATLGDGTPVQRRCVRSMRRRRRSPLR